MALGNERTEIRINGVTKMFETKLEVLKFLNIDDSSKIKVGQNVTVEGNVYMISFAGSDLTFPGHKGVGNLIKLH